jgi:hypothetical protein
MIIKNEDLYELLNVKVGDRIKVIGGDGIEYGQRLEIVENGKFSIGHHDVGHALSKLIDVEFEKVDIKLFEPISYETAMGRIVIGKETYMKYKHAGKYFECKIEEGVRKIFTYRNKCYVGQIDFVEALDYKFYVLM